MNRRGMTLLVVMWFAAFISLAAITLHQTTNDDMAITGNIRRITKAKLAATSGIHHFQVLGIFYNDLLELGDGSEMLNIIPETFLDTEVSYKVDVSLCCDLGANRFRVISTGFYKKREKIISSQEIQAIMETQ